MNKDFEEELVVTPTTVDTAFRKGLQKSKQTYLDEIKKLVLNDKDLKPQLALVEKALSSLRSYVISKGTNYSSISVYELRKYAVKEKIINRIAYLIAKHDHDLNAPPPVAVAKVAAAPVTVVNKKGPSKGSRLQQLQRQESSGSSHHPAEESYEEDFEEFVEEDTKAARDGNDFLADLPRAFETGDDSDDDNAANNGHHRNNRASPSKGRILSRRREEYEKYLLEVDSKDEQDARRNGREGDVDRDTSRDEDEYNVTALVVPTNDRLQLYPPQVANSVDISSTTSGSLPRYPYSNNNNNTNTTTTAATAVTSTTTKSTAVAAAPQQPQQRRKKKKTPEWIVARRFTLGKKIGEGSFGTVFEAMNDIGIITAVKRLTLSQFFSMTKMQAEINDVLTEIELMRGLSHPNIVEYLGAIVDQEQSHLFIFQEWVSRGSVAQLLKDLGPFPITVIRNYTRQVLLGLEYLHAMGIVHRDIKGGNILVHSDGCVKLADFGASKRLSNLDSTLSSSSNVNQPGEDQIKGTPYFMAPEVLAHSHYGRKGDIWAVGCTMIQMLTGEPPWKDMREIRNLIQLSHTVTNWRGKFPSIRGVIMVESEYAIPPMTTSSNSAAAAVSGNNGGQLSARAMATIYMTNDLEDCLILCFQKEETMRPTATTLLLCRFLDNQYSNTTSEMEESHGSSMRDHMEESGTLSKLREELNMVAVSRSGALAAGAGAGAAYPYRNGAAGNNPYGDGGGGAGSSGTGGGGSDLIHKVDRQLYAKQQQQQQQQQQNGNPYGYNNNINQAAAVLTSPIRQTVQQQQAAGGGGVPPRDRDLQRLNDYLPVGNNFAITPSSSSSFTPRTQSASDQPSNTVPNPFGRQQQQQQSMSDPNTPIRITNNGSPTRAGTSSNNPYSRSSTRGGDGVAAAAAVPAPAVRPILVPSLPITAGGSNNHNGSDYYCDEEVRGSLQGIKKKAAAVRSGSAGGSGNNNDGNLSGRSNSSRSGSRTNSREGQTPSSAGAATAGAMMAMAPNRAVHALISQSSSRDSEDYTPPPGQLDHSQEDDNDEGYHRHHASSLAAERRGKEEAANNSNSKNKPYHSRYYDEKHSEDYQATPDHHHHHSGLKDSSISYSTPSSVSISGGGGGRPSLLEHDPSSESVIDEVMNNYYRGGDGSGKATPSPNSHHYNNNNDNILLKGESTIVYSDNSKTPRRYINTAISVSNNNNKAANISAGSMRKSASTGDSIGIEAFAAGGARAGGVVGRVPRLAGIDRTAQNNGSNNNLLQGVNNYGGHMAANHPPEGMLSPIVVGSGSSSSQGKAASARVYRDTETTVGGTRPFTSKAALAGGNVVAAASAAPTVASAASKTNEKIFFPTGSNRIGDVAAVRTGGIGDAVASSLLVTTNTISVPLWDCLKCRAPNTHPRHCENCATVRGGHGQRDSHAVIRRF